VKASFPGLFVSAILIDSARRVCYKSVTEMSPRIAMVALLMLTSAICASAQKNGSIKGTVRGSAPGVILVATNQVTSKVTRTRAGADGRYVARVRAGAYRIAVALPYVAKFDKTKNYGEHAVIRDDVLENVIVSEGKETKIDFEVEKREEKAPVSIPERQPSGAAGQKSVESEPPAQADRRAVRDRWRIGFPEYDRYGDKGARGRDIPFTKGHWYDPYHQSKLKGDYPIIGNNTFMILSAVSSTNVELSRTPKPSDVSSARPGSAEFFGQPEAFSVNQIFQFTFELFHGDSTFKPRDWAIKISPTLVCRITSTRAKMASSTSTYAVARTALTRRFLWRKRLAKRSWRTSAPTMISSLRASASSRSSLTFAASSSLTTIWVHASSAVLITTVTSTTPRTLRSLKRTQTAG